MKFNYQARTPQGEIQTGVIEASSRAAVLEILGRYNLVVTALEEQAAISLFAKNVRFFGRTGKKEVVIFSRLLATLFGAGVPLREALRTVAQQTTKPLFQEVIYDIADEIEAGSPFHRALSRHPSLFNSIFVQLIRSGEAAGKLSETLELLAQQLEREHRFVSQIKGAMIYPIMVLAVLGAVFVVMVIFVIPRLADIIHELGKDLPLVTRLVIGFSNILNSLWYLFLIGGVGGFIGLRQFGKTPQGRRTIDRAKLHLPIYGQITQKIILVRIVNTLSTLISGGVSISQSLEITGDAASNVIYRNIILEALEAVKRGETLSSVFAKKEEIPPMVTQMIVVGEKSGNLSQMLQKVGVFYQSEVERTVANMSELIAPILLIVLGGGVGILVAAILVPMYGVLLEGA